MKKIIAMSFLLLSTIAMAKDLEVSCENDQGQEVLFKAALTKANRPLEVREFFVNGNEFTSRSRDISKLPVYKSGDFKIKLQFGRHFYEDVTFELQNCADSFEAVGTAVYSQYVGGFAGTREHRLDCDCSFE